MRTWCTAVAALMVGLTLAACSPQPPEPQGPSPAPADVETTDDDGGDGQAGGADGQGADDDGGPAGAEPGAQGDVVRIGLTDWTIETGDASVPAGDVTIVVTNAGGTEHDLLIHGTHGTWGTPYLAPGETYDLQISTEDGETLELECTVAGHRRAGMHTEIQVGDGRAG